MGLLHWTRSKEGPTNRQQNKLLTFLSQFLSKLWPVIIKHDKNSRFVDLL